ncbi:hypothetical protein PYCCODRAFT_1429232, partial [Trametes coccinea BRFM310]
SPLHAYDSQSLVHLPASTWKGCAADMYKLARIHPSVITRHTTGRTSLSTLTTSHPVGDQSQRFPTTGIVEANSCLLSVGKLGLLTGEEELVASSVRSGGRGMKWQAQRRVALAETRPEVKPQHIRQITISEPNPSPSGSRTVATAKSILRAWALVNRRAFVVQVPRLVA